MQSITQPLKDLLSLIFPETCAICGEGLHKNEANICTICLFKLPKTNFHQQSDNIVSKLFWGRVEIHSAASFLHFQKGGGVQKLVHSLKYKGQKEVGITIGKQYGYDLKKSTLFTGIDLIVSIPLHKTRLRSRGYNQSEYFAKGLSEVLQVPENSTALKRNISAETQTRKSRFNRWKNVATAFEVGETAIINGKHILVVDDVVTTGATLEAATIALLKAGAAKVSIATIAYTM